MDLSVNRCDEPGAARCRAPQAQRDEPGEDEKEVSEGQRHLQGLFRADGSCVGHRARAMSASSSSPDLGCEKMTSCDNFDSWLSGFMPWRPSKTATGVIMRATAMCIEGEQASHSHRSDEKGRSVCIAAGSSRLASSLRLRSFDRWDSLGVDACPPRPGRGDSVFPC